MGGNHIHMCHTYIGPKPPGPGNDHASLLLLYQDITHNPLLLLGHKQQLIPDHSLWANSNQTTVDVDQDRVEFSWLHRVLCERRHGWWCWKGPFNWHSSNSTALITRGRASFHFWVQESILRSTLTFGMLWGGQVWAPEYRTKVSLEG